jgi:hypothetical protein
MSDYVTQIFEINYPEKIHPMVVLTVGSIGGVCINHVRKRPQNGIHYK